LNRSIQHVERLFRDRQRADASYDDRAPRVSKDGFSLWMATGANDGVSFPSRELVRFRAYPLFVTRWNFGCGALSFALSRFLLLLYLFFIAPGACRPVSFKAVSIVIWPECHGILLSVVDIEFYELT
jgi:hypothetical protein